MKLLSVLLSVAGVWSLVCPVNAGETASPLLLQNIESSPLNPPSLG